MFTILELQLQFSQPNNHSWFVKYMLPLLGNQLGTKVIISQYILASAFFTLYASHDRQVGVHTDGSETDTATAGDVEMSRGFNLYYSQVAC